MEATKIDELRRALETRRDEVQAEIDRMADELQVVGQRPGAGQGGYGNHMADDGSEVMEAERLQTISGDIGDILALINGALERMDEGTYGICQRCGKPINPERLEAFPYVAFDIDCQTILERENALRAGR